MGDKIKKVDMARVREVDFVERFSENVKKLMEALGITRKIAKQAGTTLKTYKARGTLESGSVAEGDTIPLSHYETYAINWADIDVQKWSKKTTMEAILQGGFDQAVEMTTDRMLKQVQQTIRNKFFDFLATGETATGGSNLQKTIANAWGQLQIKFEDDAIESVYFVNPLDFAKYLGDAQITLQTAFGLTYLKDFLGMGTVIINSSVPKGTVYATAKENIVLYYVPTNEASLVQAQFNFTSDETGLIGIHEESDYTDCTSRDTVICGLVLFAERIDGVINSLIADSQTLGSLTVTSQAGTATGDTKITITETKGASNVYKYKVDTTETNVTYGQNVRTWTAWDGTSDITAQTGKKITIVEANPQYRALKVGSATVTAHA